MGKETKHNTDDLLEEVAQHKLSGSPIILRGRVTHLVGENIPFTLSYYIDSSGRCVCTVRTCLLFCYDATTIRLLLYYYGERAA